MKRSLQSTIQLIVAVTLPLCEGFTTSFSNQRLPNRISTSPLDASGDNWFSTLTAGESELLTSPEDKREFRKIMDPSDSGRVMNEIQLPVRNTQQHQQAPTKEEKEATRKLLEQEVVVGKRKMRASVRETGYDSMRNYIKTMCNHELLNKNEEVVLAREIQLLMRWEEKREELEGQLLR